ncbi:MAG: DNA replication and repair protein RecF [Ignavibacteriae bacterium]|nr:DNA replication and repair protein RecF [Ignavibacteriota bacterium]NOG98985.1 DNA replication and repair protein RecF [Ignavibacteriota bacterium]
MFLDKIELINFRLHKHTNLNFSENLNYIVGGNGQGKTTILEGIYYLCTTRNINQASDSDVVMFGENYFEINGVFKDLTQNKLKINFSLEANKKYLYLDNKQFYRASSVIGKFPVVTLTQSDHAITLGSPAERRKFIDSVIAQSSEVYLKTLIDYNKTLRQRSSLLSQIKESGNRSLLTQLDAWTDALVEAGTELVKRRKVFIEKFNEFIRESYFKVMENKEVPHIEYSFLDEDDPDKIGDVYKQAIAEMREQELRRATNLVGPHRDDFIFRINDNELKKFGSQGQHKTFQIALRFGEFFFLKEVLNKTPIFLMDDVFGELDVYRASKISRYLKEIGQAFITITDFSNLDYLHRSEDDYKLIVENGSVKYD